MQLTENVDRNSVRTNGRMVVFDSDVDNYLFHEILGFEMDHAIGVSLEIYQNSAPFISDVMGPA